MNLSFRSIAAALAALACSCALAQEFPARPVRLIVPYPPGASIDFVGRAIATKLGALLGQPVVIDNTGGAAGTMGTELVARAAPDGYTIGLAVPSATTIAAALGKKLAYDPIKGFTPLATLTGNVGAIVVHASHPARTLRELVELARKNPGKVSYGTSGSGSGPHLAGELLNQTQGVQLVHVPYRGSGPQLNDLLSGEVPVGILAVAPVVQHVRSGKLRVLAVLDTGRYGELPDVPTAAQALPGYEPKMSWVGMVAPAGLPAPIVRKLNAEIVKALNDPQVHRSLEVAGLPVVASTPEQFGTLLREDMEAWRRVIRAGNITAE